MHKVVFKTTNVMPLNEFRKDNKCARSISKALGLFAQTVLLHVCNSACKNHLILRFLSSHFHARFSFIFSAFCCISDTLRLVKIYVALYISVHLNYQGWVLFLKHALKKLWAKKVTLKYSKVVQKLYLKSWSHTTPGQNFCHYSQTFKCFHIKAGYR